jgi:hypothetical protein
VTIALHRNAAGRAPRKARKLSTPVQVARLHPDALSVALKLAGGDASRLRIQDQYNVVVRNAR